MVTSKAIGKRDVDTNVNPPGHVVIPMEKLTRYLLVLQDQGDKSKYLAQAGFGEHNPEALLAAILALVHSRAAVWDGGNAYGDFYRVEGTILGLNGISLDVVTIWIHLRSDGTLKPMRGQPE